MQNICEHLSCYELLKNKNYNWLNHPNWDELSHDKVFVEELLSSGNFDYVDTLPISMFDDPLIAQHLMKQENPQIKYIASHLHNELFMLQSLKYSMTNIAFFPAEMLENESIVLWYCHEYAQFHPLQFLPEKYRDNKELAYTLLKKHPNNFKDLTLELRNDKNLYATLLQSENVDIFQYAGPDIQDDDDLALRTVCINIKMYEFVSPRLRHDPDFYLNVLQRFNFALKYADPIIKDNEHCVWESIKQKVDNLEFASERLHNNHSFALQVCPGISWDRLHKLMTYWGEGVLAHLPTMRELACDIAKSHSMHLVPESVCNDWEFMHNVIMCDVKSIDYAGSELLKDCKFLEHVYAQINSIHIENGHYNPDSPQNRLFDYLPDACLDNFYFVVDLYRTFNDIFFTIILDKIIKHPVPLMLELSELKSEPDAIRHHLEKLNLYETLEKTLPVQGSQSHKTKI